MYFKYVIPVRYPLALPLGELAAKLTERALSAP